MSIDPYLSCREPGPETRNRETATSITTKADRLRKALRSLHRLDRYAIARTVVDPSSEQGRARRALRRLEGEISTMFRVAAGTEERCERCQGTGLYPVERRNDLTVAVDRAAGLCPDCDGAGVR